MMRAMYLNPLTAGLPAAEREALIKCSELREYKRNETLLDVGESTDQVYYVASGLLRVVTPARDDGFDVTTEFVARQDFFFDLSIREDSYLSKHKLVAALPSAVYFVPIAAMRDVCARHPEVVFGLLGLAMKRTSMLRTQMRRISSLPPEAVVHRVLHQLTDLAPSSGTGGFDKRISQSVIASYAGLSREVVNKTMRDMESRGLVRRDNEAVYVTGEAAVTDFGVLMDGAALTSSASRASTPPGGHKH